MKYHVVQDRTTGEAMVAGRDGQLYTPAQVDQAKQRAEAGDQEARALLDNVDMSNDFEGLSPAELMRKMIHDCPECRAAMARGEQPIMIDPRQVAEERRYRRWLVRDANRWRRRKRGP
ncbi:MAG: hypothetical protein AB7P03_22075 [Kofleriaceae bacterium]